MKGSGNVVLAAMVASASPQLKTMTKEYWNEKLQMKYNNTKALVTYLAKLTGMLFPDILSQ